MKKKILLGLLAVVICFTLVGCGDKESTGGGNSGTSGGSEQKENKEIEAYSIEAVERYIESLNLELSKVEPDFKWKLRTDKHAYGEDPENWNAQTIVIFTKENGELTNDEYDAWAKKVFDATAKVSDDGYNVVGNSYTDNESASTTKTTFEDAMDSLAPHWGFKLDDHLYIVYVSNEYSDKDKESTIGNLFYYDSVKLHISDL